MFFILHILLISLKKQHKTIRIISSLRVYPLESVPVGECTRWRRVRKEVPTTFPQEEYLTLSFIPWISAIPKPLVLPGDIDPIWRYKD